MEAYAVVETGGKQYLVQKGQTLEIELLTGEPESKVELSPVLALSDGTTLKVGKPAVAGATVKATIVKHIRGVKLISFKKKRRKGFKKRKGHRQELTVIKVESIG